MNEYYYHYTSIDSLLLILKNKTIKFNSLINVDDLEEKDSKDIKNIGKMIYVSCWTKYAAESIPMWNMYTPNMQGVRIKLRKLPFKKYHINKGEYGMNQECDTYINYEKMYKEDKYLITLDCPKIYDVQYTKDYSLIYPTILSGEILKTDEKASKASMKIDYSNIGRYKREEWRFQKEIRYVLPAAPWGYYELEKCKDDKEQALLFNKLLDPTYKNNVDYIFLELDEESLNDMEILLGPKVNEAQETMVKMIINEYCPNVKIRKSSLKIQ